MSDPFELLWECECTFTLVPHVMMWLSQVMWMALYTFCCSQKQQRAKTGTKNRFCQISQVWNVTADGIQMAFLAKFLMWIIYNY